MKHQSSLRAHLLLLVVLAVVPLFGLSVWRAVEDEEHDLEHARASLQSAALAEATRQVREIDSVRQVLVAIASAGDVRSGNPEHCQRFLEGLRGAAAAYTNFGVIDMGGSLRCTMRLRNSTQVDTSKISYFQDAVRHAGFAVGEFMHGVQTGTPVLGFGYPVTGEGGTVTGVAFAAIRLDSLQRSLGALALHPGDRLTLLDRNARVLASTDARFAIGTAFQVREMAGRVPAGGAGLQEVVDADGVERIYAFAPASWPGDGGGASVFVVTNVDRQGIVAAGRQRLIRQLSLLALFSLLGIWLAWLYAGQQVVRPARAILEATARLRSGKLDTRLHLPEARGAEFSWIAAGLNDMAQAMEERETSRLLAQQEIKDNADRLARLVDIQIELAEADITPDELTDRVAGLAQRLTGAPGAEFELIDGDDYVLRSSAGTARRPRGERRPIGQLSREAIPHGRAVRCDDVELDDRIDSGWCRRYGVRSLMASAIRVDGSAIGGLVVLSPQPGGFTDADARVLQLLTEFLGGLIQRKLAERAVVELNRDLERKVAERSREIARQEAVFRAVADQAPQVMWIVNSKGAVTYLNRYWYDLVGGAHPKWLGHEWTETVDPEDVAEMWAKWKVCTADHSVFSGMRRVRAKDGTIHTLAYRASPVYDDAGSITCWVGLDADITEIKHIETALRLSNKELETFSYSVSHDLRSPLNTIDGFSRMLEKDLKTNEGRKADHYLSRIQAAATHMGQLIEGLLALAQVSRQNLKMGSVDLSAMCEEIAEGLRREDPRRVARIVIEPGMDVYGDARMLRALLQNLMGNAWKFSSRQAASTIVVGRILAQAKAPVHFVRDNGAGFDMQYANKLFGTFQRLHRDEEFSGTGIGLATVRRIVTRHGGAVWAESVPGQGATFFFTLNAVERQDAAAVS